ncbi:MAG TPA: hypothetical protein VES40_01080 [Ilumatobacteraceae bacterium]|nr:hypothetical protein [Ilumatobacteraceae bacterium]
MIDVAEVERLAADLRLLTAALAWAAASVLTASQLTDRRAR